MRLEVGDQFTIGPNARCSNISKGVGVTVAEVNPNGDDRDYDWLVLSRSDGGRTCDDHPSHFDPINIVKANQLQNTTRKTYRLKRDTPTIKRGAILQEQCDDGTQPYEVITQDCIKGNPELDSSKVVIRDRSLVENQPSWFEEVFANQPLWLNATGLEAQKAFVASQKKKTTKKK